MTEHKDAGELLKLADLIRSHIGELAPACSLPIERWNEIAFDLYDVADRLAARPQAAEPVGWRWRYRNFPGEMGWIVVSTEPKRHDDVEVQPLYAAPPSSPTPERELNALRSNLKEAWSALAMVRETIEMIGPVGALPASEHLDGPTFMHEADALVSGIRKLASPSPVASAERIAMRDQNLKDADEFCKAAFGKFVVDVSQYTKIVAELLQRATDRALSRVEAGAVEEIQNSARPTDEAKARAGVLVVGAAGNLPPLNHDWNPQAGVGSERSSLAEAAPPSQTAAVREIEKNLDQGNTADASPLNGHPGTEVPDDPYGAFAYLVSRCASGLYRELVEKGKSDTQARLAAIHCFLDFASGEACRIARREGREPDKSKWRMATEKAFERAVKRTEPPSEDCQITEQV